MRKFVQHSFLLLLLVGCSGIQTKETPSTFQDIKKETIRNLQRQCVRDIFWNAHPEYPLTNYRTYRIWVIEQGNSGPSPEEWCLTYTRNRVA